MSAQISMFTACLLMFVQVNMGLICYQNDEKTEEILEVENDDFSYCRYFPARNSSGSLPSKKEKSDGIFKEEATDEPFDEFFNQNDSFYEVLSICLYEV
uniref:Uncharacterized protein n=1 Tax=Acrobeloides nanus TaxID=290746 RepID=A0A914CJ99_9BILA